MPDLRIERLLAAHTAIDPVFLHSPIAAHASLDSVLGCSLFSKVETLNPIRSFKGRGTEWFAATALLPGETVICASAGNFGQGMARATARRGHRCIVYAAATANPVKLAAMQSLGAQVVLAGDDFDAAKLAARERAAANPELRFAEDGAEPAIAEGAGTIAVELVQTLSRSGTTLDTVVVPLGNGALLAGVGAALRHLSPATRIVAVVAAQAPSMKLSLDEGRVVETASAATIADGVAVRTPVPAALAMLQGRFDQVVAVSEASIAQAMRLLLEHLGLAIEPAGALGIAAILSDVQQFQGQRVGTILCGANLSPAMFRHLALQLS